MSFFVLVLQRQWANERNTEVGQVHGPYPDSAAAEKALPDIKSGTPHRAGVVNEGALIIEGDFRGWETISDR